jgi:hypothetical protein
MRVVPALAGLGFLLSGCVAPPAPPQPEVARTVAPVPATDSGAKFVDAPVPNRKIMPGASDSVIRLAR